MPRGAKPKDMTGKTIGLWTVIEYSGSVRKHGVSYASWKCQCECGTIRVMLGASLRRAIKRRKTTAPSSCGCDTSSAKIAGARMRRRYKYVGGKIAPEYYTWSAMHDRCYRTTCKAYQYYGGRGITVCDRWCTPDGFEAFVEDMGRRPSDSHTIERIDNSKGYSPDNCCWATPLEQTRNRRSTIRLTYSGETLTLMEWSRRVGIDYGRLYQRLAKGWTTEDALTRPLRGAAK